MKKRFIWGSLILLVALLGVIFTTATASAHEKRQVGNYTFVVGFLDEPAYANLKNSLDLTICAGADCTYTVKDGMRVLANPVNDAEKTLKVEVSTGGSTPLALPVGPRWANPGKYNAYFMPTKVGDYTFHIFGTLNASPIDQKFTSSPTGFNAVQQVQTYPSTASNADITALQNQVQSAQNSALTATTLGIVGAVLGLLGLLVAGFVLVRKSRPAQGSSADVQTPSESLLG